MTKYIAFHNDIKRFERLAEVGEISRDAVAPLACIADAIRNAQYVIGPGHIPIGVLLDPIPVQHIKNYLKDRKAGS
ncbi:MAG: hypothetical protein ABJP02_10420 [Parasphingorhabdus sp.]|uniref:hypothetical protein n=1 Tax=Parasphingorhabdus sp. TaxID=2709688 RepID=UPI00327FACA5